MSQVEGNPEHNGGVDVVSTRVGHSRHLASIGHVLLVVHRKRVEIGTERKHPTSVRVPVEITNEAGPAGEPDRVQACELQTFGDERSGGSLLPAQLGMCMKLTSQRDQVFAVLGEPVVDRRGVRRV